IRTSRENAIGQVGSFDGASELERADESGIDAHDGGLWVRSILRKRRRDLSSHSQKVFGISRAGVERLTRELGQQRGERAALFRIVAMFRRQIGIDYCLKAAGGDDLAHLLRLIVD